MSKTEIKLTKNFNERINMPKFLILRRGEDDPKTHKPNSIEESACQVASELMYFNDSVDKLMAISSESVAATFARVKDSALCSVEIDLDGQDIWNKEISEIKESLYNFESIKNQAENELLDALIQMNEKFRDSSAFNEIIPEDEIGVYSALESLGYEDVDYKFRKTLRELFQFQELAGMFVH